MAVSITERQKFKEFIELYRDLPCLWYQKHTLYTNREARTKAYEVLLEKYKTIIEDATIESVKKRLENMRGAYKRERRKVTTALAAGDTHKPLLWYYKYFSFIDNRNGDILDSSTTLNIEDAEEEVYDFEEECQRSPQSPQRKIVKKEVSTIFIEETQEDDDYVPVTQSQEDNLKEDFVQNTQEAESFGTTVGLQLKELNPMQRFIAEKLISEVIFYGRLAKLNTASTISLNEDI